MLTRYLAAAALALTLPLVLAAQKLPPNGPDIPSVSLTGGGRPSAIEPAPGSPESPSTWNMEVIGFNDLQGRSAYQPIIVNQNGRQIAYVGHHDNQKPIVNPMTGQAEINGTSIVDVTDPAHTRYLAHIPSGRGGAQMVRVCSGDVLPNGVRGKWYLLRPHGNAAHEIYDVTDPAKPSKVVTIVDGLSGTHKSWWECDTGIAYLVANKRDEGWHGGNHLKIYDLSNPAKPVYVRDFGMVGTQPGSEESEDGEGIHGAISAGPQKNRVYIAYGTGNNGVISIVDRHKLLTEFTHGVNPTPDELRGPEVGSIRMSPDQGAHTTMPIFGVPVPGFQGHQAGRTRDLLLVTSEAARADNCGQNFPSAQLLQHRAAPHLAWLVDISHEETPWPLSTFRVQETQGDYCGRGGRFGAHSSAESFYAPYYGKIAVFAWFNAGVRIWDIRDPFAVQEVAYFVPPANKNTVPTCANAETREGGEFGTETATSACKKVGVTNNVEIDDRGLIFAADRAGSGLHVLRLTGYAKEIVSTTTSSK
ncbi:MAG: LVIVD repeat-containing protein [Vicinamibacterales bacterium]